MNSHPNALAKLIEALRALPSVGPKSAARMAYHLLERDRDAAAQLAQSLEAALLMVRRCERCNSFSERNICDLCDREDRNASQLCVVESPADLGVIEDTGVFKGLYFVLMGHLSPLDGIGPKEIGLDRLFERVRSSDGIEEVIIATGFTHEGEATAHVITETMRRMEIVATRLARGVPVGSDLEHTDLGTVAHAFGDRRRA